MLRKEQIQVLTVDCRTYLSLSGVNLNADVVPEERDGIVWEKSVLLEIVDEFFLGLKLVSKTQQGKILPISTG